MYTGKFLEYDPWGKEWTDDNPVEKSLQGEWLADGLFGVVFFFDWRLRPQCQTVVPSTL